jgi:hypothetical protein
MPLYQIANLLVDSDVVLPSLQPADAGADAWRFRIRRRGTGPRPHGWYCHERTADGRPWRSLARGEEGHVIRFWRQASFVVSFAARRVTCFPSASASLDTVRQLLLGHVVPLLFANRGALVLHASAVRTPHGAIAFVGETQAGKSTIAAALSARGCSLMADDCAIVEVVDGECRVRPMHVGVRLWPDAASVLRTAGPAARAGTQKKRRIAAEALGIQVSRRPVPLHRVYVLEPASARQPVSIEPLSRANAVVALLASSFQLEIDRPTQLLRSFDNLSAVASRVPVRRLCRPRGLVHLAALVDTVLEDAAR